MKILAQILASIVTACSLVFVVAAGSSSPTLLLIAFILWNFVPFAVLALFSFRSFPGTPNKTLDFPIIVLSTVAAAAYIYFWMYPREHQPTAPYLLIPVLGGLGLGICLILFWKARKKDQTLT